MGNPIHWGTDSEGCIVDVGFHDGYFYGVVQDGTELIIYTKSCEDEPRKIVLTGLAEMNVSDFWIGSIIGDVCLWRVSEVPHLMWEQLFAGRITPHDSDGSLRKLIENAKGRYFFALEGTYGGNVYAVCDDMKITDETFRDSR